MKAITGGWRIAFLAFFISHIPITFCIDSQAISSWHPAFLIDLVSMYCRLSGDFIMTPPFDRWFQSLVATEICLQVPFFVIAVKMMWATTSGDTDYPSWFRILCVIYGSHTATTLIPILATIWEERQDQDEERLLSEKRLLLTMFYLPYLIFPMALIGFAVAEEIPWMLSGQRQQRNRATSSKRQ